MSDNSLLTVILAISFLCVVIDIVVVWTSLFFSIQTDFLNNIAVNIIIVLGVNRHLVMKNYQTSNIGSTFSESESCTICY